MTHLLLLTEVHDGQVNIHFHGTQQECKDMVGPILHGLNNFKTDWQMSFIVVVIDQVLIEEMLPTTSG